MPENPETELVEAYPCETVDIGWVKGDSGPEIYMRFFAVGSTKHIAFAIPPNEAEDVAIKMLAHIKDVRARQLN